jgi:SRSO17 transposase
MESTLGGRFRRGWHHHVTLTILAYLFLVQLRKRLGKKKIVARASPVYAGTFKCLCFASYIISR